jgi:hypothetical protein
LTLLLFLSYRFGTQKTQVGEPHVGDRLRAQHNAGRAPVAREGGNLKRRRNLGIHTRGVRQPTEHFNVDYHGHRALNLC